MTSAREINITDKENLESDSKYYLCYVNSCNDTTKIVVINGEGNTHTINKGQLRVSNVIMHQNVMTFIAYTNDTKFRVYRLRL